MIHEYIVKIPYEKAEAIIEEFNFKDVYNLYFEEPIETVKTHDGYGYVEKKVDEVELKIYGDESEVNNLPESYFEIIEEVLKIKREDISYQIVDESLWYQTFEDIDLENGWVICYPPFENHYEGKYVLKIDPQGAFGTGLHETTKDCVKIILEQDFTSLKVLDLGAGSGILSIAASLSGAINVEAIDIQPVDREIAYNAELNGVKNILVKQMDLIARKGKINNSYDFIFINIGADETINIIEHHDLLNKASNFIISGLVEWYLEPITKKFADAGFDVKQKRQTNEWVTFHFCKNV